MALEMNLEELKEYLAMVLDMEKSIYFEEEIIRKNIQTSEKLGIAKTISKPYQKDYNEDRGTFVFMSIIVGLIVAVVVFFLTFLIPGVQLFIPVQLVISLCAFIITVAVSMKILMKDIDEAKEAERAEFTEYFRKTKKDAVRVAQENELKSTLASTNKDVESRIAESKIALEKIYGVNIIFPKYRNLIAVCSLYEYLCSGRCDTLEGANGAYNLFENEVKMNMIILQLDRIAKSLEQIKANQYMLYSAIQESNQRTNQLSSKVDQLVQAINNQVATEENINQRLGELQKAAELNAYHTERAQKELAYMNRVNYYSGRNDAAGSFRSIPPTW